MLIFFKIVIGKLNKLEEKDDFIKLIDLGTWSPTCEELFDATINKIFNKIKESSLDVACFEPRSVRPNITINSNNHRLYRKLLIDIDFMQMTTATDNYTSQFHQTVEEFTSRYNWNDTFVNKFRRVRDKEDTQLIDKSIIQLNVKSMLGIQGPKRLPADPMQVETLYERGKFKEALHLLSNCEKTSYSQFTEIKCLLRLHKKTPSLDLSVELLHKTESFWTTALKTRKPEYSNLVLQVLDYFELESLSKKCQTFLNISETQKNSNKHKLPSSSFARFQLTYLSDYLKNESSMINDCRTRLFVPDEWQVKFLNAIDSEESCIIMAPTSSGKTFASFYAMEKVLKSKNIDSVLIYVAPTKALVNQTSFAVMQRFASIDIGRDKQLCGIFTRDSKSNLLSSRILITVPQTLLILLLNPAHADWSKNIKWIVFDEVHTMGGESGTSVWEHLLLLIRCPFIALSATLSDSKRIHKWLSKVEEFRRIKSPLRLIEYSVKSSDVKRFLFTSKGLKRLNPIAYLNLSNVQNFGHLPKDMSLSAAETIELFDAMKSILPDEVSLNRIDPDQWSYFNVQISHSLFITKSSLREYEKEVKEFLLGLIFSDPQTAAKILKILRSDQNEIYPIDEVNL